MNLLATCPKCGKVLHVTGMFACMCDECTMEQRAIARQIKKGII